MNQIHYRYVNNENKPVILFLHGFLGSLEDWSDICSDLKGDYSFLLIDLPWHGNSDGAKSIAEAASSVIKLLNSLKLRPVYLYGYSMGGRLALYLTLRYPQYFRRVILESASPGLKSKKERQTRIVNDERLAQRLENESLNNFFSFWYDQPLFANLVKLDDFAQIFKRRMKNKAHRLAQSLRTLGTGQQPSLWEEIKNNRLSVKPVTGEFDAKFTGIAREMCEFNNKFSCKIVEDSGHTVYVENRQVVIEIIMEFFK
jgi:2-succinyl-6-hydroxy-2,4-cyclohexadiene-1-carboxylate synthase